VGFDTIASAANREIKRKDPAGKKVELRAGRSGMVETKISKGAANLCCLLFVRPCAGGPGSEVSFLPMSGRHGPKRVLKKQERKPRLAGRLFEKKNMEKEREKVLAGVIWPPTMNSSRE